jgi:hypothetical protein
VLILADLCQSYPNNILIQRIRGEYFSANGVRRSIFITISFIGLQGCARVL